MGSLIATGGFVFFLLVFIAVIITFGGVFIAVKIAKNLGATAADKAGNDALPITEIVAKVVAKRTNVWGTDESSTTYLVTFEPDSNKRLEFKITGEQYGQLNQGDIGTLRYQGTRYVGFIRDLHAQPIIASPLE